MPTVAVVERVKIHPPPHFHAKFAEHIAQIRIKPLAVLKRSLPPAKLAAVLDWARTRTGELTLAWTALETGQKPEKIK